MNWTRERPTKAGWYWYKEDWIGPEVVAVYPPHGPDTDYLEANDIPLDEFGNGEWFGPLEAPAD